MGHDAACDDSDKEKEDEEPAQQLEDKVKCDGHACEMMDEGDEVKVDVGVVVDNGKDHGELRAKRRRVVGQVIGA